jgi:hypothetical protein
VLVLYIKDKQGFKGENIGKHPFGKLKIRGKYNIKTYKVIGHEKER